MVGTWSRSVPTRWTSWKIFYEQFGKSLNKKSVMQMGKLESSKKFFKQFGKKLVKNCAKPIFEVEGMIKFY